MTEAIALACLLIPFIIVLGVICYRSIRELDQIKTTWALPPTEELFEKFVAVIDAEVDERMRYERRQVRHTEIRNKELRHHWLTLANRNVELAHRLTDKQLNDEITDRIAMHRKKNSHEHPEYMYNPNETQFDYMYPQWYDFIGQIDLKEKVAKEIVKQGGRDYSRGFPYY